MALDKIEGIKGESTDAKYKDEFDVLSWSWGMSNSGTAQSGGGGAGKVSVKDLTITKGTDTSSPSDSHGKVTIPEAIQMAIVCHREGKVQSAAEVCRRVLAQDPDCIDALRFLGVALHQLGQSTDGAELLRRVLELMTDCAEASNNLGNILMEIGDLVGAEEAYRRALELRPDYPDTLNNLGILHKEMGYLNDAVATFEQALDIDPHHADLWHNLGNALKKKGRIDEALTAYRQAITFKPYAEAYRNLGRMLIFAGRSNEAAEVYRQWLSHDPDNPVARHLLAACSQQEMPRRASDAFIVSTFDSFATSFNDLMARLNYRGPILVLDAINRAVCNPSRTLTVLDAGCGTGICGPLLRPYASHLMGVDLSKGMLNLARGRGVYDVLVQDELTSYLSGRKRQFDLIVSVDTLCYFGDLGPVMAVAAEALRPGGLIVFTLEAGADDASHVYDLQPHGRYTHSTQYVRKTLAGVGIHDVSVEQGFLRSEGGARVTGLVVVGSSSASV